MLFSYLAHRRACHEKQQQRTKAIAELPLAFHEPLTPADIHILSQPVSAIVASVQTSDLTPHAVFLAYSKKALQAHAQTNCLTEILIGRAENWARSATRSGPLAGMPVSIKDMVSVRGWDATIGYSAYAHKPAGQDAALVRLLRDAGAVPFVKTNLPTTALSFEAANDVFGRTENPHKKGYGPGGSSGGESALLALGGSRLGIGTDVAGSVRAPAHYAGVYSIKSSMHRFLKTGGVSTMPGQEGVPATYSPMTKTLEDLETFWRAVFQMKPWEYDHSVLNIPWREIKLPAYRPLRFGVMWDDGVVSPSPACLRALKTVTSILEKYGHQIVTLNPPSPYEGLKLASQLLLADGGRTTSVPFRTGESNDPGMVPAFRALRLPRFVMKLYAAFYRYIMRDAVYAGLIDTFYEKTVQEYYALIAARESYRAAWFKVWRGVQVGGALEAEDKGVDFVLTVPNALPALPHGGMRHGWKASGYTFLFNLLDYTAGVMPITHIRASEDALSPKFRARNAIERNYYKYYDSKAMAGLPVGVQVVGRRLEEERVLEGMKLIEQLLRKEGRAYEGIPL